MSAWMRRLGRAWALRRFSGASSPSSSTTMSSSCKGKLVALPYALLVKLTHTRTHCLAVPASSLEADLAMLHAQVDGEAYEGGVLHDELLDKGAKLWRRDLHLLNSLALERETRNCGLQPSVFARSSCLGKSWISWEVAWVKQHRP